MYYSEIFTEDFKLLYADHNINVKQAIESAKVHMSLIPESYHFYVYKLIPEETYVYEKELLHITKDTMEFVNV